MSKLKLKKTFEDFYNNVVEDIVSFLYNSDTKYESKQHMLTDVKNYLELDQKKTSKNSPKNKKEHRWITLDEYCKEVEEGKLICAYTSVRGAYKDKPCGNVMSPEDLKLVNNDKTALRCHLCHTNNPPKPKTGCIRKLLEQRNGKTVQPNKVPGVNIPDNKGIKNLMGFISGQEPTPTLDEVVGDVKSLQLENLNDEFKINYEKGWVVKGKIVCGKLENFEKDSEFSKSKLISLSDNEIKSLQEYNLEYKFSSNDEVEVEDMLNDLGDVN